MGYFMHAQPLIDLQGDTKRVEDGPVCLIFFVVCLFKGKERGEKTQGWTSIKPKSEIDKRKWM